MTGNPFTDIAIFGAPMPGSLPPSSSGGQRSGGRITALLVVGIAWGAIAACLIILKNEPASPVLAPASSSRPPAPMAPSSVAVELDVTTAPTAAPPTSTPEAWAVAGVQADRLDMVAVGVPEVPGLNGLPFAPADLTGCDEMQWYREQAGLPAHFDKVGYRESRCRNDVSSWCCHGYWQLHERFWVPTPECHVWSVDDLLGTDDIDKQRNACVAAVVYAKQGGDAWVTW